MKSIIQITLFLAAVMTLSSCGNDWLDLLPSTSIEKDEAVKNITDARSSINGIYLQFRSTSSYGGIMSWYADIAGDDMRTWGNSSTRSGATYRYDYTPQNSPTNTWNQPYTIIRFANNLLSLIDRIEVTTTEAPERDYIKGEALMARAIAHFDLCRVYGFPYMKDNGASLGACIVTTQLPADAKPVRNTVAQTYEQVITDLLAAIPLLSENRTASRARFNKWAAKLLLSRVYLYKGDNVNALREAEECIAGAEASGYALYTNANYLAQWQTKYSNESLFEIANITGQTSGNDGAPHWYAANSGTAYHEMGLTKPFYDMLNADPDDVRLKVLRMGVNYPNAFPAFILKYTSGGSVAAEANVIVYRLSEAYLIAAEAAAKLGNQNVKALQYLNAIVSRANPANSVTGTVTTDIVLNERRKELFGEGHRAFDLLRNGMTIYRTEDEFNSMFLSDHSRVIDWNNYMCIRQIPTGELEANPNVVQNPWGSN